jgi:hypothetical protein
MIYTDLSTEDFPNSKEQPFFVTSPSAGEYNCIAWAVESQNAFYWPAASRKFDWPKHLPRKATSEVFLQFFQQYGYEPCRNGEMEEGFPKIALFAKDNSLTHAARQLPNGYWTSKLGGWVDVQHTLYAMEGGIYCNVSCFYRRKIEAPLTHGLPPH